MDFQLGPGLSSDQARHVILVSGAIFVATALLPQSSYAGCTGGNQKTCTGNLLGGANFDAPVTNVTVNGLTGNIAPAVGTRGISLVGGAPTLDVDLGGRTVTVRGTNVYQGGLAGIGAWGANRVNVGVRNANINTTGIYTHGVVAGSGLGSTLNFTGRITTAGEASRGIWGNSYNGVVSANIDSVVTTTANFGDAIKLEGARGVVLYHKGSSETSGENAEGFYLRASNGAINARTFSRLKTHGFLAGAIEAHAKTNVNVLQRGLILTTLSANIDSVVTTTANFGDAIKLEGARGVVLYHKGSSETSGENAEGFYLRASNGAINARTFSRLKTHGFLAGAIEAHAKTNVNVLQRGLILTTGVGGRGIYALSDTGNVLIDSRGLVRTTGDRSKAFDITARRKANVITRGPLITSGVKSVGVSVTSQTASTEIIARSNLLTFGAEATGIIGTGLTSVSIDQRGVLRTLGDNAAGIVADSQRNAFVFNLGWLYTRGANSDGIVINSRLTDTRLAQRGLLAVYGANSVGINMSSLEGKATASITGGVRTYSANGGNSVNLFAKTSASLTLRGQVVSTANNANAINLEGQQNGATATVNGIVRALGTDSNAIVAQSTSGLLNIDITRGEIRGGGGTGSAIVLSGGLDGNTITNNGYILATSDRAVTGSAFADTLNNNNNVTGFVTLGGGNDQFNNAGVFNARGNSDFGAGASDLFANSGTLNILGNATFTGLETFDNSGGGTVNMQNGNTTDSLTLPGNFVGGGKIAVDASATASDLLTINGGVSGVTVVNVAYQTGSGTISPDGLPVIDTSGGASTADSFVLEGGAIFDGLLKYGLLRRTDGVWTLVGSVTQQAGTLLGYTSSATFAWNATGTAWNDYITAFNSGGTGAGLIDNSLYVSRFQSEGPVNGRQQAGGTWFKMLGGSTLGSTGLATSGFSQLQMSGYQAGADYNLLADNGDASKRLVAGVTFGASSFRDDKVYSPTASSPNAANAGIYAAYSDGLYDASFLAKVDRMNLMFADTGVEAGALNSNSLGFRSQAGYSLPGLMKSWSLRLSSGINYTQTRIEDTDFGHTRVTFGDSTELVGMTGMTLSYSNAAEADAIKGYAANYRLALRANIEQDFLRRHEMNIAGYGLADNGKRTVLDLGGKFDWRLGNLTAGADIGYRMGLNEAAAKSDEFKGSLTVKYKY